MTSPRSPKSQLKTVTGIFFAAWLAGLPSFQAHAKDSTPWPTQDWNSRAAEFAQERPESVSRLDRYLFQSGGKGPKTDQVVVTLHGQIIYERYGQGYDRSTPHLAWSVSKSFVNALTGIAVREGKIKTSDSICRFYASPADHCSIRVDDLLHWSSGLRWAEEYEDDGEPSDSSVLQMLYGEGQADMAQYVLSLPIEGAAGSFWRYSSGDTNLLSGLLRAAWGTDKMPSKLREFLDSIGMKGARFERDRRGTFVGSSYLYASARELAKFGYLYLKDGVWDGKRILPEGWVDFSRSLAPAMRRSVKDWVPGDIAGAQWWINQDVPELGLKRPWPHAPQDAFAALGHWGQSIVVIPSLDLVAARTGNDRGGEMDDATYIEILTELAR